MTGEPLSVIGASGLHGAGVELPLEDGLLLLAPAGYWALAPAGLELMAGASGRRLPGLAREPGAMRPLRAGWDRLGLPGTLGGLADREVLARVTDAVDRGRLQALFLPRAASPLDRVPVAAAPQPPLPVRAPATRPMRDWSSMERVEAMLRRVPAHLGGALREAFLGLVSPASLAITAAAFAALAVSQAYGVGELVDAGLALLAYGLAGLAGLQALYGLAAASVDAARATGETDLDAAAARFAGAVTTLGVAFLTALVAHAGRKAARTRAGGRAAEPDTYPVDDARPPQPAKVSASRRPDDHPDIMPPKVRSTPPEGTPVAQSPAPPAPAPPPTPRELTKALSGHGNERHGTQTTIAQQTTRVQTGLAPDGKFAPTKMATRFDSPEAELDAVSQAIARTAARDAKGLISHDLRVAPDGSVSLPRDRSIVTGFPGGYGSGVKLQKPVAPGKPVLPTGQLPNAVVVLERQPGTDQWRPVTQYPTDLSVTP